MSVLISTLLDFRPASPRRQPEHFWGSLYHQLRLLLVVVALHLEHARYTCSTATRFLINRLEPRRFSYDSSPRLYLCLAQVSTWLPIIQTMAMYSAQWRAPNGSQQARNLTRAFVHLQRALSKSSGSTCNARAQIDVVIPLDGGLEHCPERHARSPSQSPGANTRTPSFHHRRSHGRVAWHSTRTCDAIISTPVQRKTNAM